MQSDRNKREGSSILRRQLLAPAVVFLIAAVAVASLIWHWDQLDRQDERAHATNLADEYADSLQRNLERGLSAAFALAALVRQGRGTVANF